MLKRNGEQLKTIHDAAKAIGVHQRTLRKWIADKLIPDTFERHYDGKRIWGRPHPNWFRVFKDSDIRRLKEYRKRNYYQRNKKPLG